MRFSRTVSLLALASAAISAQAADAYSNLGSAPNVYSNGNGYRIGSFTQGAQFTTTAGGTLSGFTVAMSNDGPSGQQSYTLRLFADDGTDNLGTLLGTYSGLSTGIQFSSGPNPALSLVTATGPAVSIANGGVYWLVASSSTTDLSWGASLSTMGNRYTEGYSDPTYLNYTAAFSVQVSSVPGPGAAVAFALMALRRRKRA